MMGRDGPYCKFVYPPHQLQMFQGSRIGKFTAIAAEISIMEGQQSFIKYQGVIKGEVAKGLYRNVQK